MFEIKVFRNNKFDVYQSKKPEFTVGRAADADIIISSDVISRYHLKVIVSADAILIMDLKSANGTFKNGIKLDPDKTYIVTQFDKIRLGNMKDDIRIFDTRNEAVKDRAEDKAEKKSKSEVLPTPRPEEAKPVAIEKKIPKTVTAPAATPKAQSYRPEPRSVISLAEFSKQGELIVEDARKKAKDLLEHAKAEAEENLAHVIKNAEQILFDSKEQAQKIIENAEESAKVISQKAQVDYDKVIDQAHIQAKLITDKSVIQAQMSLEESKRQAESLIQNSKLDLENEKIKLKQEWFREQEKLAELERLKREEEDKIFKKYLFDERESLRKELDLKKSEFAKDLLKKNEKMKEEESAFINKIKDLQIEIETIEKKRNELKTNYVQEGLLLKKDFEDKKKTEEEKFLSLKNDYSLQSEQLRKKYEEERRREEENFSRLKDDYEKKAIKLKMGLEEEKGNSEMLLLEIKKKYADELEVYKKKEMDRINSALKAEQEQLQERRKIDEVQFRFSLKKSALSLLDQHLRRELDKNKVNEIVQSLSEKFDQVDESYSSTFSEEPVVLKLDTEKNVQTRSSRTAMVLMASLSVAILAIFIFWESIYDSIRNSETYAKYMFDKMQVESVYVPVQSKSWRETYAERILFLEGYADFKTNQMYMDKWTQHLTNVENARMLKLNEDEMIRFIAREMNLVNQLAALQKTIDARQVDLGMAKLKSAEDEARADFIKILKSEDNLSTLLKWEKQFVSEHMARLEQQRLPSETNKSK